MLLPLHQKITTTTIKSEKIMKTFKLNLSKEMLTKVIKTLNPLIISEDEIIKPDEIRELYKLRLNMIGFEVKIGVPPCESDVYNFDLVGDTGYYMRAYIVEEDDNTVIFLGRMYRETGKDVWDSDSLEIIG